MPPQITFFDCNCRIGRPAVCTERELSSTAELLAEMDRAGIACALVHHVLAREWSPARGNARLLAEIEGQGRLYPCFVGLPEATRELPPPREFAATVRERRGAVRLWPKEHQYTIAGWCMGETLAALAELAVPVLVDAAQIDWAGLSALLAEYPGLPVILLDTYYRVDRHIYPLWDRHNNLYLETTTYQVHRGIEAVVRRFGPERLVFGTNLPVLETGGPVAQIMYAEIPDADKTAIAGATLRRLLGA